MPCKHSVITIPSCKVCTKCGVVIDDYLLVPEKDFKNSNPYKKLPNVK